MHQNKLDLCDKYEWTICDYLDTSGLGCTFGQDIQDSALACPSPVLGREVQDLAMAEQGSLTLHTGILLPAHSQR